MFPDEPFSLPDLRTTRRAVNKAQPGLSANYHVTASSAARPLGNGTCRCDR
jgi:hypothetical protein